eukprot:2514937-Amphidinium_carterae.2
MPARHSAALLFFRHKFRVVVLSTLLVGHPNSSPFVAHKPPHPPPQLSPEQLEVGGLLQPLANIHSHVGLHAAFNTSRLTQHTPPVAMQDTHTMCIARARNARVDLHTKQKRTFARRGRD